MIRPPVGSIRRLIIFMVVVLPQPDGPTSTQISPALIVSDRSSTAGGRIAVALGDVVEGDHGAASRRGKRRRRDAVGGRAASGAVLTTE